MAQFERHEENQAKDAVGSSPTNNAPQRVKRINQATELSTDEWTHYTDFSRVNGMVVRQLAVDAEIKINDKTNDPLTVNPGDAIDGEINELWVRNAETYPESLDKELMVLWLNPTSLQSSRSLAPLLRDIYKNRYNYAKGEQVNALILELDTGLYGGSSFVEFWGFPSNYDDASTPMIQIYSSVSPLEDGDSETGPGGLRRLAQWDWEDELADADSPVVNDAGYFHVVMNNAYRYVYLVVDFGEDAGSDLYGDCELEVLSTR